MPSTPHSPGARNGYKTTDDPERVAIFTDDQEDDLGGA